MSLKANQIVSGAAINIIGLGMSSFLIRILFGLKDQQRIVPHFIPSRSLFWGTSPTWGRSCSINTSWSMSPSCWSPCSPSSCTGRGGDSWSSRPGSTRAADTVGINPERVRYVCVVISGVLAGAGGAFMSLGQLHFFMDEMVGGRGFIALAALIFGRWDPVGGLIACLIFGGADALQFRAQGLGFDIPHQFMLMFPYVLTLVILVLFGGRTQGPAAIGIPYRKGAG